MSGIIFPAEWYPQSAVQVTWPHKETDWADDLEEVTACYIVFSKEILKRQKLLVVCCNAGEIEKYFSQDEQKNLICVEIESNDTWTRDHGAISLLIDDRPAISDFGFNGWGLKFAANRDNLITGRLFEKSVFQPGVAYRNNLHFILEGGSIESDGKGTLLTTSQCLLAPNRNQPMTQDEIDDYLKQSLGAERVLWLHYGYLAGDDTDSHIDTLARFCDEQTIAYVKCDDPQDEHYEELRMMEEELESFVAHDGRPYRLVGLPMADAVYHDGERLPATYANFLIINGAVLIPFYGTEKDQIAKDQLQKIFPDREIIGVDCRPLIRQHGSLHCVTMQFPIGFL
ncbi:agmatine deiminase family protein [Proteiniphilum acetatigenes]|uniref:agmatine deiminase family protein n=1 Tax=Proteiniphilum acetatigenes TaxID=294710 RepID=UPI00036D6356|nr:agmatine deiminase family protein [Proteiniphilum acetatigenes]SFK73395.1 Agmatine/peptidylarginine deiminase [Porphyromonadaceae bacterium KH3CP3RA]